MKGTFTLGIYIAIGITGAAFGQSSDNVKTIKTVPVPVTGSDHVKTIKTDPVPVTTAARHPPTIELVRPPPTAPSATPERIVITHGVGGSIYEHNLKFWGYRQVGNEVEIRGPCYSACTLITAYVGKDKLCIAQGSFLAFHAVRSAEKRRSCRPKPLSRIGSSRWKSAIGSTAWADTKTAARRLLDDVRPRPVGYGLSEVCIVKTLVLGFVLLAASIVAAQAEDRFADRRKCISDMYEVYEDMAVAKRLCDPRNFVTNPNEYGWVCKADNDATRVKGYGAKQKKDAIAACE